MPRDWTFTWNNYTEKDIQTCNELVCRYMVYGFEVAPETGTPHLQGYIEFDGTMRFETLQKRLYGAHIEPRKKDRVRNRNYCMKMNNAVERGIWHVQGKRNDLDGARTMALEGGMREVTTYCCAQQIRVAEKFLTYNEPHRNTRPTVICLYGASGTGKSYLAEKVAGEDVYFKDDTKWWDGYDKQRVTILNDFRGSWWKLSYMLNLLDSYGMRVETKGGYRQINSPVIIITSIHPPSGWYAYGSEEPINQMLRRISYTFEITVENRDLICAQVVPLVSEVGGNTITPTSE